MPCLHIVGDPSGARPGAVHLLRVYHNLSWGFFAPLLQCAQPPPLLQFALARLPSRAQTPPPPPPPPPPAFSPLSEGALWAAFRQLLFRAP